MASGKNTDPIGERYIQDLQQDSRAEPEGPTAYLAVYHAGDIAPTPNSALAHVPTSIFISLICGNGCLALIKQSISAWLVFVVKLESEF